MSRLRVLALGGVAVGVALRVVLSAVVGMTAEESQAVALAKTLSFDPHHPSLVYWGQGLGMAGLYLLALAHAVFGDHLVLLRLPWLAVSVLTLLALYRLVRRALGRPQALLATMLLAVDQFHLTYAYGFNPEPLSMACEVAAFWALWRGLTAPTHQPRWWLLVGLLCGVGYYTKRTFPLLVGGLALCLLLVPRPLGARWDRRRTGRALGLVAAPFVLLALPAFWWEARHPMDSQYLSTWIEALSPFRGIGLSTPALYFGEVFH